MMDRRSGVSQRMAGRLGGRLINEIGLLGGTRDDAFRLDTDTEDKEFIRVAASVVRPYLVTVDYDCCLVNGSLPEGDVDVDKRITPRTFPATQVGMREIDVFLTLLGNDRTFVETLQELNRYGFRAATLPEIFALRKQHSEEIKSRCPIAALGSCAGIVGGATYPHVPYLDYTNRRWRLRLEMISHHTIFTGGEWYIAAVSQAVA